MHEDIEKLLVLQERDRSIAHAEQEIAGLEHERVEVNSRSADAETAHEAAQQKAKELEARKNGLEVEVEAEQEKIRTYARQQMDTKDNEQYKALGRQQETCKETISDLETTEIEVLEEIDSHAEVSQAAKTELDEANAAKAKALGEIDERETNLKTKLEGLAVQRTESAGKVEASVLKQYDRLRARKGTNIVVGIEHGACGGCHMKLPESDVIEIKTDPKSIIARTAAAFFITREIWLWNRIRTNPKYFLYFSLQKHSEIFNTNFTLEGWRIAFVL